MKKIPLISFINIPSCDNTVLTVYPPPGILSMSAYLKSKGYETDYIDADVLRLTPKALVEQLRKRKKLPNLIGLTLNASQLNKADDYLVLLRSELPECKIVVGGPYVTGVGKKIFTDFADIDYAVIKEGEHAIAQLIEYLLGERKIENVVNLLYKRDEEVCQNRVERIEDLNLLPLPDYELVENIIDKYTAPQPSIGSPSIAIMCSRGCPYNCTFCSSPNNWDRRITYRSVDSVIEEVLYLKQKFDVKEIFFQDDTLNARPKWFIELCDKIISNKLNESIFFKCPFRVNKNILNEDILKKAKQANFWLIFYGVENGDPVMLKRMNKNISIAEIKRAFKLTRQAGLASLASFMVGNQGESFETVERSKKLIQEIMPDYGGAAAAVPFPGSDLYDYAVEEKLIMIDNFKNYHFGDSILKTKELGTDEITYLAGMLNETMRSVKQSFRYRLISRNNILTKIDNDGLYEKEYWDREVMRSARKATMVLAKAKPEHNKIAISIMADYPNIERRPVKLILKVNGKKHRYLIQDSLWFDLHLDMSEVRPDGLLLLEWKVSRTWNPKKVGLNEDDRELGVTVSNVYTYLSAI